MSQNKPAIRRLDEDETEDYPGLVVCDGRVSGSITAGRSRLPLWALTSYLQDAWKVVEKHYEDTHGLTGQTFSYFIHHLLDNRDAFARLLCVLADVERRNDEESDIRFLCWRDRPESVERVRKALQACLDSLSTDQGNLSRDQGGNQPQGDSST